MKQGILADRLYANIVGMLGSGEHLQIAGLLKQADKTVLDIESAKGIRSLLYDDPWQIECNLDFVELPTSPQWYEWPLETRAGHGGGEAATTGCLIVPHPTEANLATVITGWESDGPARHAFAVAILDFELMTYYAWGARTKFSRTADESLERIMSTVATTMPAGFADEISIVTDGSEEVVEAAMRDATSEIPLLLAILIAGKCRGGLRLVDADGHSNASLEPPSRKTGLAASVSAMLGRTQKGMSRKTTNKTVQLAWYR